MESSFAKTPNVSVCSSLYPSAFAAIAEEQTRACYNVSHSPPDFGAESVKQHAILLDVELASLLCLLRVLHLGCRGAHLEHCLCEALYVAKFGVVLDCTVEFVG